MSRWPRHELSAALIGLLAFAAISCKQPAQQPPTPTPSPPPAQPAVSAPPPVTKETGVAQKALPPVKQPTVQTALITFLTGDVETNTSNSWAPANIGDLLTASRRVRVGAKSSCELQFGNMATARIESNTEVSIAKLALGTTRQVGLDLATGAIVSKVQELAGNDQYRVWTQTAVAGVRGTEFRVAATPDKKTELAVQEGVVTVVPPEAIISPAAPAQEAVAREVEKTVVDSAPTVKANEQVVISEQDFAPVRKQLAEVKKQIDAGATTEAVKPLVTETVAATEKAAPKPAPISEQQKAALAVTKTMQLLPTGPAPPPQPPAPKAGAAPTPAPTPAPARPRAVLLSIKVVPSQAEIYLDDLLVGTNGFSGLYQPGRTINFAVRLAGYDSKAFPITIPDSGIELTVTLTRSQVPLSVEASPTTAQISIDGKQVGVGTYQGTYPDGQQLQIEVKAPGYDSQSRTVTVGKNTGTVAFNLAKQIEYGNLTVNTTPSDASIYLNGEYKGTGSYSARYQANTNLQIRASLRGYADSSATVTIPANATTSRTLTLQPKPIDARFSVASAPLVRSLAVWNDNLISGDKNGVLRSTGRTGTANWQVATKNSPNENSKPVVANDIVFLSGVKEFVGIDAGGGNKLFTVSLGQANAHLFGRSAVVANGALYYPTDTTIDVYGERNGQLLRRIPLPGASNMSASASGGNLFIADQQGTLYEINAQSGKVIAQIASSAVQPVAISPVLRGNHVFFVGRRGTAVLADLSTGKVVWQRPLEANQSMAVFTDPVIGSGGVYLLAKNTLFGLSLSNGNNLFTPIRNASASPFVDGQSLYYGTTDAKLVRASALTGTVEAAVSVGSQITTRPVPFGDDIAVGTASGQIVLIYPPMMPAAQ